MHVTVGEMVHSVRDCSALVLYGVEHVMQHRKLRLKPDSRVSISQGMQIISKPINVSIHAVHVCSNLANLLLR